MSDRRAFGAVFANEWRGRQVEKEQTEPSRLAQAQRNLGYEHVRDPEVDRVRELLGIEA